MKKKASNDVDEMRAHYDFDYSKSRPNRFAQRFKPGIVKAVVLDPDVAEVFDSSESVNALLRSVIAALPKSKPGHRVAKTLTKKVG